MNSREKRSPELIREYFDLLRQKKYGWKVSLSERSIAFSESLTQLLSFLSNLSEISHKSIESSRRTEVVIKEELDALEERISSFEADLIASRKSSYQVQEKLVELDSQDFSAEEIKPEEIPHLSWQKSLFALVSEITKDLNSLFSRTTYIARQLSSIHLDNGIKIIITITLFAIFGIVFILVQIFWWHSNTFALLIIVLLSFYFRHKLVFIKKIHEQTCRHSFTQAQINSIKYEIETEKSRLYSEKQSLEENLETIEAGYERLKASRQRLLLRQQWIEIFVAIEEQKICKIEQAKQQKYLEHQGTLQELEMQEIEKKEARLLDLESKIQDWLASDIEQLTEEAMRKLKIMPVGGGVKQNALQNEPIRVLIGVTERTSESLTVESDSDRTFRDDNEEVLIDSNDYESHPSHNGAKRMYGVYEFLVIFLCPNFLSYYKCYWNFIRRKSVNEETCEYLYDSIVSVKVQEKSSVRLKDDTQKRVYSKRLLLSTKDGKVVCFRISKHKIDVTHSLKLSQIDQAAVAIRDMLRQRRIDVISVENINEEQS